MALNFGNTPDPETVLEPGRRIAVLVGNGKYEDPTILNLLGPPKDVAGLQTVLGNEERGNFEIHVLIDDGFLTVRKTIASIAHQCKISDLLLIYYSGSGFINSGRLFLPVADTDVELAYATALECEFILETLNRTKAGQKVLILDCCNAGAFFHGNRGIPDGFIALTSCGASEACLDRSDGGVFTKCLVDGLSSNDADGDGDGRVTVNEAFDYVRNKLSIENTQASPQLWVWNSPEPIFLTIAARPVFISYSRKDSSFVKPLYDMFQQKDIPAWMDVEGVQGGDDWLSRIAAALKSSRLVAAIVSPHAFESKWFRRELEFADKRTIPILPIVVGNTEIHSWFELRFDALQRLDCDPESSASVKVVVDRVAELYGKI